MAQQQFDKSTKDFREPLLRVLGAKAGFKPGIEIAFEDTYDPVCAIVGCTRDQYGRQPTKDGAPDGVLWVERWVQWAFNDLVKDGTGKRLGRGKWSLTPEGCDKARTLCGIVTVATPAPDPVVSVVPEPDPVTPPEAGMSLDVGPGQLDTDYSSDPYLRSLAVQATPCYGGFSPQSPLCATCPVKCGCTNALAASLSQTAATLLTEDKVEEARKQAKANAEARRKAAGTAPTPSSRPAQAPVSGTPSIPLNGTTRQIEMPVEALCRHCNQPIPQGAKAMWVKDSTPNGPSAMLHLDCYTTLTGGTK